MRYFELHRDIDESGISGTGLVAEGVEFWDGEVAMRWRTPTSSTAVYHSVVELEHIHSHGGKTRIVWQGEGNDEEAITIKVSADTLTAALNCLEACAQDPAEPERYVEWYVHAADEIRKAGAER